MARLSFTTLATPDQSGIEVIQMAKKYGYQGVDIRVGSYKSELQMNSTINEIHKLRNVFDSEGIIPSSLLCYIELDKEDVYDWEKLKNEIFRCLNISYELGSPYIRIFLDSPKRFINKNEYISKAAEMLNYILEKDKSGVNILLQNHRKTASASEIAEIIEKIDSKNLGMVYSPDHSIIVNEDLYEVCNKVRPFTRQLYIADIKLCDTGYIDFLPGKGDVPIHKIYEFFGGEDFDGWITFKWEKVWVKELEEPEFALPYFIDYFSKHVIRCK